MTSYIPCAAHFHFHFPSSIFHLPSTRISLSLPGYLIFHLFRLHLPHYFNTLMLNASQFSAAVSFCTFTIYLPFTHSTCTQYSMRIPTSYLYFTLYSFVSSCRHGLLLAPVPTVAVETASVQSAKPKLLLLLSLSGVAHYFAVQPVSRATRASNWRNPVFAPCPVLWRQPLPLHLSRNPRGHQAMTRLGLGGWVRHLMHVLPRLRAGLSLRPRQQNPTTPCHWPRHWPQGAGYLH